MYQALADFRRTTFPKIYKKWLVNHDDPDIRDDFKRELKKLTVNPSSFVPNEQDTSEPSIDDGFRDLGLLR